MRMTVEELIKELSTKDPKSAVQFKYHGLDATLNDVARIDALASITVIVLERRNS